MQIERADGIVLSGARFSRDEGYTFLTAWRITSRLAFLFKRNNRLAIDWSVAGTDRPQGLISRRARSAAGPGQLLQYQLRTDTGGILAQVSIALASSLPMAATVLFGQWNA